MELLVNQDLDLDPEPLTVNCNTTEGLQKSNYKAVVNNNYKKTSTSTLYGMRQGIKNFQFNTIDHTAVILKLSLFAGVLVAIF